jgi:hypothetical protein
VLSDKELERLISAIEFCYSVPFIDDVEDFIFESIWSYVKDIPIDNPLSRTKKLFDVVDVKKKTGWSAKTLVLNSSTAKDCEFVIQRADVFKKAVELGYPRLTENSEPQEIGNAVLEHWKQKVELDSEFQGVGDRRLVLLLKNSKRNEFRIIEESLNVPMHEDLIWDWTNEARLGLQAVRKDDNFVAFRWYRNQKQLFERIKITHEIPSFTIRPARINPSVIIEKFKSLQI